MEYKDFFRLFNEILEELGKIIKNEGKVGESRIRSFLKDLKWLQVFILSLATAGNTRLNDLILNRLFFPSSHGRICSF